MEGCTWRPRDSGRLLEDHPPPFSSAQDIGVNINTNGQTDDQDGFDTHHFSPRIGFVLFQPRQSVFVN
jgi:hypothetical protein